MYRFLKPLFLVAGFCLAGCPRFALIDQRITAVEDKQKKEKEWTHKELRKLAARALCKEHVADFIEQCESGTCPAQKGEHVLRFMSAQPHAVLYITGADDLTRIPDWRIDGLRKLVDENQQLFTSKYLIVARTQSALLRPKAPPPRGKAGTKPTPTAAEVNDHNRAVQLAQEDAERRANLIREEILIKKLGIRESKILGPHIFPFCAKPEEIDKATVGIDVPQVNEPKDLDLGVWVFHVDC